MAAIITPAEIAVSRTGPGDPPVYNWIYKRSR